MLPPVLLLLLLLLQGQAFLLGLVVGPTQLWTCLPRLLLHVLQQMKVTAVELCPAAAAAVYLRCPNQLL
jgi:hypothetical protein